jgi:glycosyltransferase involved in cell wall biosynthesis
MTPEFKFLCRDADIIFVLSNSEKEIVCEKRGTRSGVTRISTGPVLADQYDRETFRKEYNPSGKPLVLFLGQKLRYKGFDRLLQAAHLVWAEVPETLFMFIGPHSTKSRDIFSRYDDRRIIDLETVDLETKTAALASADILCQPSLQESFGAVFLEAWALGKPVIGGKTPAVQELIEDGINGYLVSEDIAELGDRILTLLQNKEIREKMSIAGKNKLSAVYSWDKITRTVMTTYEQAVKGSHGRE